MTNLILSSNFSENKLYGVGEATLQNESITITAEKGTTVVLLREINKVMLLTADSKRSIVNGRTELGDVYTLENNGKKLILKVESEAIKNETNLFVSSDPIIDATSTKRKTTLTVGILIMILLIVSVVFGIKQKNLKVFNSVSAERLKTATENYELQTRESFIIAKEIATKLKGDGYKNSKLDELLTKINETESDILGEVKPEIKDLLELTLQINGFNGTKLVSTGETIFVIDEKEKNIIRLDTNGKNANIVAKKDILEGVKEIASYEDRLFTLNDDGIYEVNETRNKLKDNEWSNPLLYLYSANIYLVDRDNNQILRYSGPPAGGGKTFGDKTDWLAPGIEVDFSKVIDMTIDGSIWLLSSSGKVTKFTNGNPINISMEGIVEKLENPTAIYTNENLKYVYILDKEKGRVVVIEKNGKFKMQYVGDQIKNTTDLVADEENKKIILLSGSKLIYFEPK